MVWRTRTFRQQPVRQKRRHGGQHATPAESGHSSRLVRDTRRQERAESSRHGAARLRRCAARARPPPPQDLAAPRAELCSPRASWTEDRGIDRRGSVDGGPADRLSAIFHDNAGRAVACRRSARIPRLRRNCRRMPHDRRGRACRPDIGETNFSHGPCALAAPARGAARQTQAHLGYRAALARQRRRRMPIVAAARRHCYALATPPRPWR